MPTNRTRRTRNRRTTDIDAAMEELFTTGKVSDGADCWDLWDRDLTYATWHRVKDRKLFTVAWEVFESDGDVTCFEDFTWLDREGYQKWVKDNVGGLNSEDYTAHGASTCQPKSG
jgi:hypothetical protein